MKLTRHIKESKDKNGVLINFVFCFRCITFIDISEYEIGDDIDCPECHRDDYIVTDADNPNNKFYR
jgi:hypothetical protein